MYKYYVYNVTRNSYCTITSEAVLEVGQSVLIHFDNEELADELNECKVLKILERVFH